MELLFVAQQGVASMTQACSQLIGFLTSALSIRSDCGTFDIKLTTKTPQL